MLRPRPGRGRQEGAFLRPPPAAPTASRRQDAGHPEQGLPNRAAERAPFWDAADARNRLGLSPWTNPDAAFAQDGPATGGGSRGPCRQRLPPARRATVPCGRGRHAGRGPPPKGPALRSKPSACRLAPGPCPLPGEGTSGPQPPRPFLVIYRTPLPPHHPQTGEGHAPPPVGEREASLTPRALSRCTPLQSVCAPLSLGTDQRTGKGKVPYSLSSSGNQRPAGSSSPPSPTPCPLSSSHDKPSGRPEPHP